MQLSEIVDYLAGFLHIASTPDDQRAVNGLQVENNGVVTRLAVAVDACQATINMAAEAGADLLIVHHGLFWSGLEPIAGIHGRRIRALISHNLSLYSAHLPLDCHPEVGNNHVLARRLGIADLKPFGEFEGIRIGVAGDITVTRSALQSLLESKLGAKAMMTGDGPDNVRRIAVVTGAGSSALREACSEGIDTLLTGEAPHHASLLAEELGINLVLAGHYATETVGVQALGAHLSDRFRIPWSFLDHPTGL